MKLKLILGGFLFMIFGGGIWSLPAIKLTRSREPWLTALLLIGLAATVPILRYWRTGGFDYGFWIWLAGVAIFSLFRAILGMRRAIEPFFAAHMTTIIMCLAISVPHHFR